MDGSRSLAVCVWANSEVDENTAGEDIEEADSEVNEDDKGFDKCHAIGEAEDVTAVTAVSGGIDSNSGTVA